MPSVALFCDRTAICYGPHTTEGLFTHGNQCFVLNCSGVFYCAIPMIHIGLINPKDVTNVGSVLRAIGCYQADGLIYTGNRYNTAMRYRTDTNRVRDKALLQHTDNILEAGAQLPEGTHLVAIELVEGAQPLPEFEHPQNAFYVFGPEDGNLPQEVVDAADEVVYVPTVGCMNLAATVNVLLYDRMAKKGLDSDKQQDELIRFSRDNNNRLKVR